MATPWLRSQSQHPHLSIQPVSVPCANCRRAPVFPFVSLPCPWNLAGMRRKHPVFTRCSESAFHASGPREAFPPTSHKQPGSGVTSVWCVISGSPNSFHVVFGKHRRAFTLRVGKGVKKTTIEQNAISLWLTWNGAWTAPIAIICHSWHAWPVTETRPADSFSQKPPTSSPAPVLGARVTLAGPHI